MRYFALLLRFKMLFYNSRVFESWLIPSSFILHCKIFAVKRSFIFALLFSLNFLIFDKLQQIFSTNSPLVASAKSRNARGASHQPAFMRNLTISQACLRCIPSIWVRPCVPNVIEGGEDAGVNQG